MRSVRALDVLFTAYSAANLLSRVVVAQAARAARAAEASNLRRENIREVPPDNNEFEERGYNHSNFADGVEKETIDIDHDITRTNKEDRRVPNVIEIPPSSTPVIPNETERIAFMNPSREEKIFPSPSHISNTFQSLQPRQTLDASTRNTATATATLKSIQDSPFNASVATEVKRRYAKPTISTTLAAELETIPESQIQPIHMKASRVPSSRIGRLFHYGSLAAGLSVGAAGEFMRRTVNSSGDQGSLLMSEANVSRLVDKLSQMRGAALKIGQFLSIQDTQVLSPQVEQIFRRVQNNAHYMPNWQMERVMAAELGPDWKSKFSHFDPVPFAAASIGQVHAATLASNGMPLAVKVQFPAVFESIDSDLKNLSMILAASAVLPKGLFLENTLKATKAELEDECDYVREANCAKRFRRELEGDERFEVMQIVDELSTKKVLSMERMNGVPIMQAENWSQPLRDEIGTSILSLCLRELFHFRFMQTDPNWTNFLYNRETGKIQLIDFGASQEYSREFMDDWLRLLQSGIDGDKERCARYSLKLRYLTGEESQEMVDAHTKSIILLGTPFKRSTSQPYNFSDQSVSEEIRELIPFMLHNRLTPPPRETYSLNRKLSGAFLLCGRLRARVDCAQVWEEVTAGYEFTTPE